MRDTNLTREELRAIGLRRMLEHFAGSNAEAVARRALKVPGSLHLTLDDSEGRELSLSDDEADALIAAAMGQAAESNPLNEPRSAPSSPPHPTATLALLHELGRSAAGLVEQWIGSLASWTPQQPVSEVPLAGDETRRPVYVGAEAQLELLFEPQILRTRLAWAAGPLRVMAAHDADGNIRSLRASVSTRACTADAAAILLELSDEAGRSVTLTLSPERPSMVRAAPSLLSNWPALAVKLYSEGAS